LYSSSFIERYDYDAYGETFAWELDDPSVTARPSTDLLYAGEQWDADLGMQYLRARYYLPAQGIFNRLDPFFGNQDDPQSLHKYAYVHGDPVNGIDPSGAVSIVSLSVTMGISMGLLGVTFLSFGEDPLEDFVRGLLAGARLGAGIAFAINKGFAIAIGVLAAFVQVVIDLIVTTESSAGIFLNSLEAFAEGVFDAAVDQYLSFLKLGKASGGIQLLIDLLSELMSQFAAFRDWAATPVRQFSRAMISFILTIAFASFGQICPDAVANRLTTLVASINPFSYGSSGVNFNDGVADRLLDSRFFVDNIEPVITQFFSRLGESFAEYF
jgi:RHS repeat-associated protein